jgi:hypothetical protein
MDSVKKNYLYKYKKMIGYNQLGWKDSDYSVYECVLKHRKMELIMNFKNI